MTDPSETTPPVVRVVSGHPDPGELAAVVAVLLSRSGAQQGAGAGGEVRGGALWGAPSTLVRRGGGPHPGGWGGASATLRG